MERNRKADPLVSVVITTYNHATLLHHAIKTVVDQDYRPLEVIVADDESTDGTQALVEGLNNPIVSYLRLKHSGYPSVTLAEGIKAARGDIVMCLEGDDQYLPGKITKQVAFLAAHPQCDFLFADIYHVEGVEKDFIVPDPTRHETYFSNVRPPSGPLSIRNFFPVPAVHINTVSMRRRVVEKVLPNGEFRYIWDWDFELRVLKNGFTIQAMFDVVAVYRRNRKGLSSSSLSIQRAVDEQIRMIGQYRDDLPPGVHDGMVERWHYDWVKQAMKAGEIKTMEGLLKAPHFPASFRYRLKAFFYLAQTRVKSRFASRKP